MVERYRDRSSEKGRASKRAERAKNHTTSSEPPAGLRAGERLGEKAVSA